MYNAKKLIEDFRGLVAWHQPADPTYPDLPADLIPEDASRFVDGTHPLCTIENLYNAGPDFLHYENTGADEAGQAFAAWLLNIVNDATVFMVSQFIKQRKLEDSNKTLIDKLRLYDGIGSYNERIIKKGRFVGLEARVRNQEGLYIFFNSVGLQLDTALPGGVPIYLFHSTSLEPLATYNTGAVKASTFSWHTAPATFGVSYGDNYNSDGVYRIGYFEADLGAAQAINRKSTWGKAPCAGCSDWNVSSFNRWSKHVEINAISAPVTEGVANFDLIKYEPSMNYGLNLELTVACDLTRFFGQQKSLFADALCGAVVIKCLEKIAYSTRMNFITDKTRQLAMADLDGSDPASFRASWDDELKSRQVDFSGLNSTCMPCQKKAGIKYSSI